MKNYIKNNVTTRQTNKYTMINNIYYCIFLNLTKLIHLIHIMLHTATLSNTLVNPKYPNPNKALTKISPLIL